MGQTGVAPTPGGPSEQAVAAFAARLRGRARGPADEGYDAARRVYNAMIDRRPRLVVECADVADVIECVRFAQGEGLKPAVRCGSHSVPGFGTCDGGLVIDLGRLKGIRVDPGKKTAQVGGGATWGDVDHATHAFGLATPGGIISTTGVGGLTLGGGFGHLSRRYGLACDNLISADVVTAGGDLVRASAHSHPELFWALRGGGGNFGVVTSFEFKLHAVKDVYVGLALFEQERGVEVMRFFADYMARAPRELSAFFAYLIVPPAAPFPERLHMRTMCGMVYVHTGGPEKGEKRTLALRRWGEPVFATSHAAPYPQVQRMFDALLPHGLHHYWKADFVRELGEEAIAEHARFGPRIPTVNSAMHIYPMDGAVHDARESDTAFAWRDVKFTHILAAVSADAAPMEGYKNWVRDYWAALHPHSAGGAYVNFLMDEGQERIAASYRGNAARLAGVKRAYDPANLFSVNQNIRPAEE